MNKGLWRPCFRLWLPTILLLSCWATPSTGAFRFLREGMTAPSVTGKDFVTNEPVNTDQWLGDNVIVVVFWASWSNRSMEQLSHLAQFARSHPEVNCKILAINVDGQTMSDADRDQVSSFITDLDPPFPVLLDEGLEHFHRYGVIAVPSTAVIDSSGVLRYGPSGYSLTTRDLIEDSVRVMLGLIAPSEGSPVEEGYRPTKQASRYYNMALNQFGREQYSRALKNLDQSEKADSGFAQPKVLRGEVYLALDSIARALESFAEAVALDSGSVAAWTGWGVSHLRNQDFDAAWDKLATARQLDSTYTPAILGGAICLAHRGETALAIDSLNLARELNMRDPLIHYYLGQLHIRSGDTSEAVNAYRTSLEILFPAE